MPSSSESDPWLAPRMKAKAKIAGGEQQVQDAVIAAMEQFLAEARRLVLDEPGALHAAAGDTGDIPAGPPRPDAFPNEPIWLQMVDKIVMPVIGLLFGEEFRAAARRATISDEPYREAFLEQARDRLRLWPRGVYEEIRYELLESHREGEGIPEQTARIGNVLRIDAPSRRLQAEINHVERELGEGDYPPNPDLDPAEEPALRRKRGDLYEELDSDKGRWEWMAERIARTETMAALNSGTHDGTVALAQETGEVLHKTWLSTSDERTRDSHRVADGQTVPIAEPFIVGGFPLDHPGDPAGPAQEVIQCFPGDVAVWAPSGITTVFRRWYEGPLVRIETAAGVELSATPNHPILTAGGWKSIQDLAVGDELLQTVPVERVSIADPHVDDGPATFEQIYRAADEDAFSERVAVVLVDFHGDISDGDVDVVTVNGSLAGTADANSAEGFGDVVLARCDHAHGPRTDLGAGEPGLPLTGMITPAATATLTACPRCSVSTCSKGGPFLKTERVHTDLIGLTSSPRFDPGLPESSGDSSPCDVEGSRKGLHRFPGQVAADDLARVDRTDLTGHIRDLDTRVLQSPIYGRAADAENYRQRVHGFSGTVTADQVIRVDREPFSGHVYNLSTGDGTYTGNTIVAHNCRCTALYLDEEEAPAALAAYQTKLAEQAEAALTAAGSQEDDDMADDAAPEPTKLPIGWRGIIAPMGVPTGDGRMLAVKTAQELRLRDMPLVFSSQEALSSGHDGSVITGNIQHVWVTRDNMIGGCGRLDLGSPDGRETARQLHEGFARWVSADPDDVTWGERWFGLDGKPIEAPTEEEWIAAEEAVWAGEPSPMADRKLVMCMEDYRLVGATRVAQPAFNEAVIEGVYDEKDLVPPEGVHLVGGAVLVASAASLVAGAGPVKPSADWFAKPDLEGPTALHIGDDGQIYGHLAVFDTCHTGFSSCVRPPRSASGYALFHVGAVNTLEGTTLPVGKITLGGGHADIRLGIRAAMCHYDDASAAVAVVRAYEDEYGIAVSGAIVPGVTEEQIAELRRSPLSGDWREYNGRLELIAAHGVNVPGFPVPRAMVASAGPGSDTTAAIVAAGALPTEPAMSRLADRIGRRRDAMSPQKLAALVARELREQERRAQRAGELLKRLKLDPAARAAAAAERAGLPTPERTS